MTLQATDLRLYASSGSAEFTLLPDASGLTFDSKYNDAGVINFDYPADKAKAAGLTDSSVVGVQAASDSALVSHRWTGTADASTSEQYFESRVVHTNLVTNPSLRGTPSTTTPLWTGFTTLASGQGAASTTSAYGSNISAAPGQLVRAQILVRAPSAATWTVQIRETKANLFGTQPVLATQAVTLAEGEWATINLSGTVTAADSDGFRLYVGSAGLEFHAALATLGSPEAAFFDGSSPRRIEKGSFTKELERYLVFSTNTDKVVDGTPMRSFSGKVSLSFLSDATVYPVNWNPTTKTGAKPAGHDFIESKIGTIWRTLILRAKDRGCFPFINETTFDGIAGSNGAAWDTTISQMYGGGENYLQILQDMMTRGLVDAWMDGWDLKMQNGGTRGRYLDIGTLELRAAKNVTDISVSTDTSDSASTVFIIGDDGVAIERHSSPAQTVLGRRRERSVAQGGISDVGTLTILADAELETAGRVPTEETIGISPDLTPFFDFDVADWVWIRFDGDDVPLQRRIWQVAASVEDNGTVTYGITANSILFEDDVKTKRKIDAYTGAGGSYGAVNSGTDISIPNAPTAPSASSNLYIGPDGLWAASVLLTWVAPTTNVDGSLITDFESFEYGWKYSTDADYQTFGTEASPGRISPVIPGSFVNLRVRAVDTSGNRSAWASAAQHEVTKDTTGPLTPATPTVAVDPFGVKVSWSGLTSTGAQQPVDFDFAQVWQSGVSNFTPGDVNTQMIGIMRKAGSVLALGVAAPASTYIKLVSIDKTGNVSPASAQATFTRSTVIEDSIYQQGNLIDNPTKLNAQGRWVGSSGTLAMADEPTLLHGSAARVLKFSSTGNGTAQSGYFPVDPSKCYEIRISVRDTAIVASTQLYFGLNGQGSTTIAGVNPLTGATSSSSNFYFSHSATPDLGEYIHLVGYLFPAGTNPADALGLGYLGTNDGFTVNHGHAIMSQLHTGMQVRVLNWSNTGPSRDIFLANTIVSEIDFQSLKNAQKAVGLATTAQASADGKNTITHSISAPTGTLNGNGKQAIAGDTWFRNNGSGVIIGQWEYVAGSTNLFVLKELGHQTIATIDIGKGTVGFLKATNVEANSLATEKLTVASQDNLVEDPRFLWDPLATNWVVTGGATRVLAAARDAGPVARLPAAATLTAARFIPCDDQIALRLLAYVKPTTTPAAHVLDAQGVKTNTIKLTVTWLNATGATSDSDFPVHNTDPSITPTPLVAPLSGGAWGLISGILGSSEFPKPPTGTVGFKYRIQNNHSGSIDIDMVSATRAANASLVVDGSITSKEISADYIGAQKISAAQIEGGTVSAGVAFLGEVAVGRFIKIDGETSTFGIYSDDQHLNELFEVSPLGGISKIPTESEGVSTFGSVRLKWNDSHILAGGGLTVDSGVSDPTSKPTVSSGLKPALVVDAEGDGVMEPIDSANHNFRGLTWDYIANCWVRLVVPSSGAAGNCYLQKLGGLQGEVFDTIPLGNVIGLTENDMNGICRQGDHYYTCVYDNANGGEYYIGKFRADNGNFVQTSNQATPFTGVSGRASVGVNSGGTHIFLCYNAGGGVIKASRWTTNLTYAGTHDNTTMVKQGTDQTLVTGWAGSTDIMGFLIGDTNAQSYFDFTPSSGGRQYAIVTGNNIIAVDWTSYSPAVSARQPNYDVPLPGSVTNGGVAHRPLPLLQNYTTGFHSVQQSSGILGQHTRYINPSFTNKVYATYAFRGVHPSPPTPDYQTQDSPPSSALGITTGQWAFVNLPQLPVGADYHEVFAGIGTSLPSDANLKKRPEQVFNNTLVFNPSVAGGADIPRSPSATPANTFPGTSTAFVQSNPEVSGWILHGDGKSSFRSPLLPDEPVTLGMYNVETERTGPYWNWTLITPNSNFMNYNANSGNQGRYRVRNGCLQMKGVMAPGSTAGATGVTTSSTTTDNYYFTLPAAIANRLNFDEPITIVQQGSGGNNYGFRIMNSGDCHMHRYSGTASYVAGGGGTYMPIAINFPLDDD